MSKIAVEKAVQLVYGVVIFMWYIFQRSAVVPSGRKFGRFIQKGRIKRNGSDEPRTNTDTICSSNILMVAKNRITHGFTFMTAGALNYSAGRRVSCPGSRQYCWIWYYTVIWKQQCGGGEGRGRTKKQRQQLVATESPNTCCGMPQVVLHTSLLDWLYCALWTRVHTYYSTYPQVGCPSKLVSIRNNRNWNRN